MAKAVRRASARKTGARKPTPGTPTKKPATKPATQRPPAKAATQRPATDSVPPRHARTPNAPRHAAETEQRILEAARSVFIRRGTAGARMQEIAAEAGVNQALLHYYFRSKDQLGAAVFGQMASRLFPALLQVLSADAPLDTKVDRIIELYHENLLRHPFLPGYVLSELHHHPERIETVIARIGGGDPATVIQPMFAQLARQIDAEVSAGRMRPIEPRQFVVNLVSLCLFPFAARPMLSLMLGLDESTFPAFIDERKRTLAAFFKNALRPCA